MALQLYQFTQLVTNIATAMQASASVALNFTVGSVLRAIAEATAGVVLWLQGIILDVLNLTRASTSSGADLDSWGADYGFTRLAASTATGLVAFARFTPTQQAVIPINATVQTSDGTQRFIVIIDTANVAYNPSLGGYVLAANVAGIGVPVMAVNPGTQANVLAGSIAVLSTAIPGVDTVSNPSAYINGIDAESDTAFRARFVLYLASLSRATRAAVSYAVTSVQQGVVCTITENQNYDGTTNMGFFYVVADDGTGSPSSGMLTNIANAVEAVRPLGSRFGVFPPIILTANVSMTLTTAAGYTHNAVVASVAAALQNFINKLPLGTSLPYTQIASVVYAVPGVSNATSILLNSSTGDLVADQKSKVLAGTFTIA